MCSEKVYLTPNKRYFTAQYGKIVTKTYTTMTAFKTDHKRRAITCPKPIGLNSSLIRYVNITESRSVQVQFERVPCVLHPMALQFTERWFERTKEKIILTVYRKKFINAPIEKLPSFHLLYVSIFLFRFLVWSRKPRMSSNNFIWKLFRWFMLSEIVFKIAEPITPHSG